MADLKVKKGEGAELSKISFDNIFDIQKLNDDYESVQLIAAGVTHVSPLAWFEKVEDGKIVSLHFFDNVKDLSEMNWEKSVLDIEVGEYVVIYENNGRICVSTFEDDEDSHVFFVRWLLDRICEKVIDLENSDEEKGEE